jgi:hypothetical protein
MRDYALHRHDGGVEIMQIAPFAAMVDGDAVNLLPVRVRDGKVVVFTAPVGSPIELLYNSPEYEVTKWGPQRQAEIASVAPINRSTLPSDKYFRPAWEHVGGKIEINMVKARDAHRDHLRRLRAPKLADLDIEYQRADERGDLLAKRDIAARKQALRDVTADPAIEAAKTPDELRAVIPVVLK